MVYIEDKVLLKKAEANPKKCYAKNYKGQDHTPFFPLTAYFSGKQAFYLKDGTHFLGEQTLGFRGVMCGDPEP